MILEDELVQSLLKKIVIKIKERYFSERNIYIYLLSEKDKKIIEYVNNILNIIETSIRFYQYRRAVRYILVLEVICQKYFSELKIKEIISKINI
jgi:hypothetical protein